VVFINGILIYSRSTHEYIEHLRIILRTSEEHKLYAKLKMCEFCLDRVLFLGHVVTKGRISADPTKVEAIMNWPKPTTTTKVRSFLHMEGYYRRLIESFSKLALPISKLTRKNTKFEWSEERE